MLPIVVGSRQQVKINQSIFAYGGKIVVLVDARSASAVEVFARVIQLEKRGVVIGDLTSGAVMEAKHYDERVGTDVVVFYGASITESDLIMSDGKSLGKTGMTPDELMFCPPRQIWRMEKTRSWLMRWRLLA